MSIMENLETLIWSMILSGHYMNLMTIDENSQIKLKMEYTYPGNQFLSGIFENFMGNIPDSIYHLSMIWNFMNSEIIGGRLDRLDVILRKNAETSGIIYKPPMGVNVNQEILERMHGELFDENINHEELLLKIQQYLRINEEIDERKIKIFDEARRFTDTWVDEFREDRKNVAFITYNFLVLEEDGRIATKSGFIFSINGRQLMPGTVTANERIPNHNYRPIGDGLFLDRDHESLVDYPPQRVGGTLRTYDTERKLVITLEDLFPNIISGTVKLYSELDICHSCDNIINLYRNNHPFITIDTYGNVRELPVRISQLFE